MCSIFNSNQFMQKIRIEWNFFTNKNDKLAALTLTVLWYQLQRNTVLNLRWIYRYIYYHYSLHCAFYFFLCRTIYSFIYIFIHSYFCTEIKTCNLLCSNQMMQNTNTKSEYGIFGWYELIYNLFFQLYNSYFLQTKFHFLNLLKTT